jgi:hypothetical protein
MTDEIRKAAEEYVNEYWDKPNFSDMKVDFVEYAIREDRKRRENQEYTYPDEIILTPPPRQEGTIKVKLKYAGRSKPPVIENPYEDSLEDMLVELAKLFNHQIRLHWAIRGWRFEKYNFVSGSWRHTAEYESPTEAVRAALNELRKEEK